MTVSKHRPKAGAGALLVLLTLTAIVMLDRNASGGQAAAQPGGGALTLGVANKFRSRSAPAVIQAVEKEAVIYLGRLCEIGPTEPLYRSPRHPCTASLLEAVARIAGPRRSIAANPEAIERPSPVEPPAGCRFHPRCVNRQPICGVRTPAWREIESGRWAACHFPLRLA